MKLTFLCSALLIAYVGAVEHSYSSSPRADEDPENDLNLLQTQIAVQTLQEDGAMAPEHKAEAKVGKEVPSFASMYPNHFSFWGRRAAILTETGESQGPKIDPPSNEEYKLQSSDRTSFSQNGQDRILKPMLSTINGGFFVESGAGDGETDSNTLMYERSHGWTGLLVEPDPHQFSALKAKHRRAHLYDGCLSPSLIIQKVVFDSPDGQINLQAVPLHTLLQTIDRNVVDFWSLDIQGSEGQVLENTDFSKVEVGVLLVGNFDNVDNKRRIREVMSRNGFWEVGEIANQDAVFVNHQYFEKRNLQVPGREMLDQ